MKKLFSWFTALLLVLTGGIFLSSCTQADKKAVIVTYESLPYGMENLWTNYSKGNNLALNNDNRNIYFSFKDNCSWGNLRLHIDGVNSKGEVQRILTDGIYLEDSAASKIVLDSNSTESRKSYKYTIDKQYIDSLKEIKLIFAGEADLEKTDIRLTNLVVPTYLTEANLRFSIRSGATRFYAPNSTNPELTLTQLNDLFGEEKLLEVSRYADLELTAWEINQTSLTRVIFATNNALCRYVNQYENGVLKTKAIIDEVDSSQTIEIYLTDPGVEYAKSLHYSFNSALNIRQASSVNEINFPLFDGTTDGVTIKYYVGNDEITTFDDLKTHINDKLTFKFESEFDITILDYLIDSNIKFHIPSQINIVLTKEENNDKYIYSFSNVNNLFLNNLDLIYIFEPDYEEVLKLDGLMKAISYTTQSSNGEGTSQYIVFDDYGANVLSVLDPNNQSTYNEYILKDSKVLIDLRVTTVTFGTYSSLTIEYAKNKSLKIDISTNNSGNSKNEADGVECNYEFVVDETSAGSDFYQLLHIEFTLDKASTCNNNTILFKLK